MRLPFVPRRAFEALGMAHSLLRKRLVEEQTARCEAEAELAVLQKWITREMSIRAKAPRSTSRRRGRILRACVRYRAELAEQRRQIRQLTDQLLDATGYQGEPLLPEARRVLDLDKEDA